MQRAVRMTRRALRWTAGACAVIGAGACGRCERPPPPARPSQPTLAVAPDPSAATTGRRVVAVGQITQTWHVGTWSPASITLSDVAAGDAIAVLGLSWGDLEAGGDTAAVLAPIDDRGSLARVIDQGPEIVGRKKPPAFAQLYIELQAAPGAHTIIPPYLGGPAGDGALYVVQIRGLTEHRVVGAGQTRITGDRLSGVMVAAADTAGAAVAPGDLAIALGGYDNTGPRDAPGFGALAPAWRVLGTQIDATNNLPSQLCVAIAPAPSPSWTWSDPAVNVAAAVIGVVR